MNNDESFLNENNGNNSITGKKIDIENASSELKKEEQEFYFDAYFSSNISTEVNIGRLRKTMPNLCSECGSHLQLRIKECSAVELGEDILEEEEYLYCPKCKISYDYEPKKQRRKRDRSDRDIDFDDHKDRRKEGKNDRNKKPSNTSKNYGTDRNGSDRRSKRQSFKKTKI